MTKFKTAMYKALMAGSIYVVIGLLWHAIVFYTDGAVSYYGSIFFFLVHFLGLTLSKALYVYRIDEPSSVKHAVAIFMIFVNAVVVVTAVFTYQMMRNTNKRLKKAAAEDHHAP